MTIPISVAGQPASYRSRYSSAAVRSWRIPLFAKLVIGMFVTLALTTLVVLYFASTTPASDLPELPSTYIPGNILPPLANDAICFPPEYRYSSCQVEIAGQSVYVRYDPSTRMMVRAGIKGRGHKLGEFIAAWGIPTSFDRDDASAIIVVYWGTRAVILYTASFSPSSPVTLIQYDFEAQPASAWRGFTNAERLSE